MIHTLTYIPKVLVLFIIGVMWEGGAVSAQTTVAKRIYVAKSGKDSNPGTEERPYASPYAAVQEIANLKKKGHTGAIEVLIKEGLYYIDKPLLIGPESSGTATAPVTIKAMEGQRVTWSGATPLQLKWEEVGNGIWKSQVPKRMSFQHIYTDGEPMIRARYPNYDPTVLPFNGYAVDAIAPERVKRWKAPKGAYVHALHIGRWGGFHYRVVGKNENGEVQLEGGEQNNRPSKMHETYRYVENVFEELDAVNEWYLDEEDGILYYYPKMGVNPNDLKLEVPMQENILTIKGSRSRPVHDVRIQGISFVHTAPTFMKTAEPLLRSDWAIYRQGAVLIEGAERCTVIGSDFTDLGGNAVFVSNYNREVVISNNLVERIGAGAINFVGNPDAVRSPAFRYEEFVPIAEMDTVPGPRGDDYPKDCEVSDNLIRRIGLIEKQVAGVQIAMASTIRVLHNTIYEVPRAGINVGDGTWGGHDIGYNDVFHTVLETSDHGAFNSWGRDRFWHPDRSEMDRLTAQHPNWVTLDAVKTTLIHDNRFQCDHGWDIDLDDGSSNYLIYNNLCLSGGLKLREGFYRTVYNNVMVNNGFHPHVWFRNSHDVFRNNVVMQAHQDIQIKYWGDTVDYNYYTHAEALALDQAKGIEEHGQVIDPEFQDAERGDFRLVGNRVLGFQNFDMLNFGVKSPRLKKMADRPEIPHLLMSKSANKSEVYEWKGGTFKSIETLGEQSAAGLPAIAGVLVIKVGEGGISFNGRLRPGDVIVACQGELVNTVADFQRIVKRDNYAEHIGLTIYRNQTKHVLRIKQ
ncbi:PDZ domain-containing protein [Sphingobacterium sp. SYP-B4668]|uniref:PDZ domain-containing protein n=1 Tax=Sphingobacterium sp. SYP-B4668 TaxID=2996035 RepID=UPI0022DD4206|nr:PDZ domain-containing protein [Sphingobacterium sp. SYP-B4668]